MVAAARHYDASADFVLKSWPLRLYSGQGALDRLPAEMARLGCARAFVVTGRTVGEGPLFARLAAILGPRLAGSFRAMQAHSPLEDVQAAAQAARAAGADLLVALGAGSVIQAVRVVAILLAEKGPVAALVTRYPPDGPAIGARLEAPKLPIVNVLTVASTAQNRGGSPVRAPDGGPRLEFFDPKTRPAAIIWDAEALASAPPRMVRASAGAIWWRAMMDMGGAGGPALGDLGYRQVFELAERAVDRLDGADDPAARFDLCLASFLMNRGADEGWGPVAHWPARVVYALAASLFNLHEGVSQGDAYAAMTGPVLRAFGPREPGAVANMAAALGLPADAGALAAAIGARFARLGLAADLTALGIPRAAAGAVLDNAMVNFNADPRREFPGERPALRHALAACWGEGGA